MAQSGCLGVLLAPTVAANSGDIVVSAIPGGYLIGRLRAKTPPDDGWAWEYIRAESDLSAAIKFARQVAERAGVSSWTCDGEVEFRKIAGPPYAGGPLTSR
jgi:hypothetical protein